METKTTENNNWRKQIQQLGWGAFLFFFIKGLVWIAIFFGLGKWLKDLF
ncbi:MAG: hypothetical protein ACI9XO_004189 [Paraglaciecola sp.]|jgi:hypothetical protein